MVSECLFVDVVIHTIVDTSMTRNMCVAFVPLPHHHVQVQLFLFSDLPLIPLIDPPPPNHLFLSFKAIFSLHSSC